MGTISLPHNSEQWEWCIAASYISSATLDGTISAINFDKLSPPEEFFPSIIWELGLGKLTPYIPNLADLLPDGIAWQRVRGTPDAVARALGWLQVSAKIEPAWHGRNWWNSFQLRFNYLPENDNPLLERIEAVTTLSVPKRSQLRRGVYHYDAGALIADGSHLDHAMLERESGIAITSADTLWSFGRTYGLAS